jgi:hypothetical protein
MAALPNDLSMAEPDPDAVHEYYAEANILSADIQQPVQDVIKPQAFVELSKRGRCGDKGHYHYKKADPFRLDGIISHEGGYTQVAGHPSSKIAGFSTLATSVVEGLNILDVVTADRVVAQISTVHPAYGTGQVPEVTFLGTRFDNLRIAGHKVEVDRCLDILGPKLAGDESYFENGGVLDRISQQYDRIATADELPDWASEEYPKGRPVLNGNGTLKCSLVNRVMGAPKFSFGHVIDLPHFGKIFLGELKVTRERGNPGEGIYDKYRFRLTMIRTKMGCIGEGNANIATADTNGTGGKGSGG